MIHSLFARAVSSASRRRLSSAAAAAATRATSAARDRSASLAASAASVSAPPPPSSIPRRRSSARLTTVMSATEVTSAAVRTSPWYRRGSRSVGRWKQSQSRDASRDTASAFGASETTAASASRTSPGANPCAMSSSYARASFWRDRSDAATAGRRGSSETARAAAASSADDDRASRETASSARRTLASARALISTLGAVVWAPVPLPAAPPPRPWAPPRPGKRLSNLDDCFLFGFGMASLDRRVPNQRGASRRRSPPRYPRATRTISHARALNS
mmetsp:Transcript_1701/g.6633  ORF Transcript_1701/g.6633 Transcript_1701/m.6633 type:complete len:275 (-) Transcript_1701:3-827(-)